MNSEAELPDDVIAELEANRKITAIKLLRTHLGIDLKEAKELVDAYVEQNPSSSSPQMPTTDTGIGRIVLLIIGVSLIYGIYKFFT
jgi:hypothetical protein